MNVSFEVDGMPVTKGSWKPGRGRGGRIVLRPDNDGEASWAKQVGWAARQAMRCPLEPSKLARYRVELEFTLELPKGRAGRRDIDKLARSVLDALTGIVWADDEQVDQLHLEKWIVGRSTAARERPGLRATIVML